MKKHLKNDYFIRIYYYVCATRKTIDIAKKLKKSNFISSKQVKQRQNNFYLAKTKMAENKTIIIRKPTRNTSPRFIIR